MPHPTASPPLSALPSGWKRVESRRYPGCHYYLRLDGTATWLLEGQSRRDLPRQLQSIYQQDFDKDEALVRRMNPSQAALTTHRHSSYHAHPKVDPSRDRETYLSLKQQDFVPFAPKPNYKPVHPPHAPRPFGHDSLYRTTYAPYTIDAESGEVTSEALSAFALKEGGTEADGQREMSEGMARMGGGRHGKKGGRGGGVRGGGGMVSHSSANRPPHTKSNNGVSNKRAAAAVKGARPPPRTVVVVSPRTSNSTHPTALYSSIDGIHSGGGDDRRSLTHRLPTDEDSLCAKRGTAAHAIHAAATRRGGGGGGGCAATATLKGRVVGAHHGARSSAYHPAIAALRHTGSSDEEDCIDGHEDDLDGSDGGIALDGSSEENSDSPAPRMHNHHQPRGAAHKYRPHSAPSQRIKDSMAALAQLQQARREERTQQQLPTQNSGPQQRCATGGAPIPRPPVAAARGGQGGRTHIDCADSGTTSNSDGAADQHTLQPQPQKRRPFQARPKDMSEGRKIPFTSTTDYRAHYVNFRPERPIIAHPSDQVSFGERRSFDVAAAADGGVDGGDYASDFVADAADKHPNSLYRLDFRGEQTFLGKTRKSVVHHGTMRGIPSRYVSRTAIEYAADSSFRERMRAVDEAVVRRLKDTSSLGEGY